MLTIKQIKKVQILKTPLEVCRNELNYPTGTPYKIRASKKKKKVS